ncbi:putative glutamate receptor ionotropic, delta-2-like 31, partial [Homarus americanus]
LQQVENGGHALIEAESYLQYVATLKGAVNTYILKVNYRASHIAWYFPKHTPWTYKFNHYISVFIESGLCRYWWKEAQTNFKRNMKFREVGVNVGNRGSRPLSLADYQGAVIVYGVCMGVAVMVGLLEGFCCVMSKSWVRRRHKTKA